MKLMPVLSVLRSSSVDISLHEVVVKKIIVDNKICDLEQKKNHKLNGSLG